MTKKIIIKSLIYGFILGCILFAIAPLGLGISFIEQLKPVLVPGVSLTQLIVGNTIGSKSILLAVFLNGIIFTIPFFAFSIFKTKEN